MKLAYITIVIFTVFAVGYAVLPAFHVCPEPDCPEHICPEPELMPVRDIQMALRDMGYLEPDEIDGIWCNQRMIDAWKAWEEDMLDRESDKWYRFFGGAE